MKISVKKDKERIRLGSGKLYIVERDDNALSTALVSPAATLSYCESIATDENLLGLISGGAAIEYTKNAQTIKDDLEIVSKTVLNTEDVTLKSGVITWNGNTLTKICETARVTDDPILGLRQVLIGGIENADGKTYALVFVHEDKVDGNIYAVITGKNTAGFKLEFKKDAATVVDATFTAEALDNTGTKLAILEQIPQSGVLKVTSEAGSTNGKTKLTLTNTLGTGESYAYKTAATLDMPAYLDAATVGAAAGNYTAWNGSDEITATTGNKLLLVVLNGDNKVVKAGVVTVTSKAS